MKEEGAPEDRANFPAAIPTAEAYRSQIAIRWDHSAPWARTNRDGSNSRQRSPPPPSPPSPHSYTGAQLPTTPVARTMATAGDGNREREQKPGSGAMV